MLGHCGLMNRSVVVGALALALGTGCAHQEVIPGTTVADSDVNRDIIKTVEQYRAAVEARDIDRLLMLASEHYFEDSGTPRPDDDYGYDGLKQMLTTRLVRVRSLRYRIQYRNIRLDGDRAEVEVFLNGAFELLSESGEKYRPVSDYHRFLLEHTAKDRWKFLSGM
jgi:hypothetical protein